MSNVSAPQLLPIPRVALARPARPNPNVGAPGRVTWLPLTKLVIDARYQRAVGERGERNIRHIVEHFDWACFSPLVVSRRADGLYAVIDGQHRAIAALSHGGIDRVPCLVLDTSPEREALAFAVINSQVTSILAQHLHYARVTSGDPHALEIARICEISGVRILRYARMYSKQKSGDTLAINTLSSCLKRYGADTLITSLQTITQTGDGNPGGLRAPIIHATCGVLHYNKRWRDAGERLFKAMETTTVDRLYERALRDQAASSGPLKQFYAQHLYALLERELDSGSLLQKSNGASEQPRP